MTKLAYILETIAFLQYTVNFVDGLKYSWDIISSRATYDDYDYVVCDVICVM